MLTRLSSPAWRGGVSLVSVALAVTLAIALGPEGSADESPPGEAASELSIEDIALHDDQAVFVPGTLTEPLRIRTCAVEPPRSEAGQAEVFGAVLLADTGEMLWEAEASRPTVPASVTKLVTAQAALRVLGPDFRFTTRVLAGENPEELWLVAGGDPTLTQTSLGETTYYPNPGRLTDLIDQVTVFLTGADTATSLTTLGVDLTRYADFPQWNDSWRPQAARLGFIAPVTALMVDGGRENPADRLSARSADPSREATDAVLRLLGQQTGSWGLTAVGGRAPSGGTVIAQVSSAPVSQLIDQMIRDSDNQIAEALIREVALALSVTSFDEAARAGLPADTSWSDEFFAADGSGLSSANRMSARLAVSVMSDVVTDVNAAALSQSLARPGQQGSLVRRFPENSDLAGAVAAKTGSLEGVRSLAGVIDTPDRLVFALFVVGSQVTDDTREDIDSLVAEFYVCGENLAHWGPTGEGE